LVALVKGLEVELSEERANDLLRSDFLRCVGEQWLR